MPQPKVLVDYSRCDPTRCEQGICAAAQLCRKKVLKQGSPGEMPDLYPAMCLGCTDCLAACPQGAIRLMR
jgi:ATP-binding cassette subfamily E protein 1